MHREQNMDPNKIFEKYLAGNLSSEEVEFFDNWVLDKKNKQEVLNLIESGYFKEKGLEDVTPFKIFVEKIREKKSAEPGAILMKQKWFWAKVAAALFFILMGGWIGYHLDSLIGNNNQYAALNATITRTDQVTRLTLSDGSKVILAKNSSLSFPEKSAMTAVMYLEGEAYFDLMPSQKNIKIKTKDFTTITKDSKINIRSFSSDSIVNIVVEKGKAEIKQNPTVMPLVKLRPAIKDSTSSHEDLNKKIIYLSANEQVTYDKRTNMTALSSFDSTRKPLLMIYPVETGKILNDQKVIQFNNVPLSEITGFLKNKFQLEFNVRVDEKKLPRYSGNFNSKENPLNILMVVCEKLNLKYSIEKNEIKIDQ